MLMKTRTPWNSTDEKGAKRSAMLAAPVKARAMRDRPWVLLFILGVLVHTRAPAHTAQKKNCNSSGITCLIHVRNTTMAFIPTT